MYYLTSPADFIAGERVELHPRLDLWLAGLRYGVVVSTSRTKVAVKLDKGRTVSLAPTDLAHI